MNMPKLLPRSTSQRSGCDDEDQDDIPASDLPGESEKVEGQSESQQEGPHEGQPTTAERGGNQAILRILGEKEKVISFILYRRDLTTFEYCAVLFYLCGFKNVLVYIDVEFFS